MRFYELYAGMAAVSWAIHGNLPPVKYQGGKRGYAKQIVGILGLSKDMHIVLVEKDKYVAAANKVLWGGLGNYAISFAERLNTMPEAEQRIQWEVWRQQAIINGWDDLSDEEIGARWLWMRPRTVAMVSPPECSPGDRQVRSSDWINNAPSRAVRLLSPDARADVVHGNAEDMIPHAGAVVYLDPPYEGTKGYRAGTSTWDGVMKIAQSWVDAGSVVGISANVELGSETYELENKGKKRSYGHTAEYLTVLRP